MHDFEVMLLFGTSSTQHTAKDNYRQKYLISYLESSFTILLGMDSKLTYLWTTVFLTGGGFVLIIYLHAMSATAAVATSKDS